MVQGVPFEMESCKGGKNGMSDKEYPIPIVNGMNIEIK